MLSQPWCDGDQRTDKKKKKNHGALLVRSSRQLLTDIWKPFLVRSYWKWGGIDGPSERGGSGNKRQESPYFLPTPSSFFILSFVSGGMFSCPARV